MDRHPEPAPTAKRPLGVNEEQLLLMVESVKDYAIFMLDPGGHVVSWNAGARRIKGYAEEEILGRHFSTFYPEPDLLARKPQRELEIAKRTGVYEEEGWRVRKDGSLFWASVVITALFDRDGRLVGFGKVTRDLTERRAAEEALRRSEEQYRMLVEGVKDYALFMLDGDGRVRTWNAGAERINGYTAPEIIGKHLATFYPPADAAAGRPEQEILTATETGRYEEEGWRVRKDGSLYWASVVLTALRDDSGRLRGFAKVTRDLTERRRLELSLLEKNAALEAALRAKDRFLATMSHELRTPLNAILGYTGTLLMKLPGPLNPEQEKQLRTVKAGARHLLSLINDLLDLAKINSGKVEVRREPVSCGPLLREVATTLRPIAEEKGLELEVGTPHGEVVVETDRRALSQILLNLANNACKFTDRGSIRLEVSGGGPDGAEVVFRVADTGIGIRPEDRARLFQPFVRLGGGDAEGRTGTGLGLHLSERFAELIGGRLGVESEFGCGSCFTLALPRRPASQSTNGK